MRCHRRLLIISYKDRVTNARRKIHAAIGEYDGLLTLVKKRKLRWFSHVSRSSGLAKALYPTGHSERKKKKSQTEEEVGRQYQRVDRKTLPAQLGQLRTGLEVIKLFSCSTQLSMKFFPLINVKMPTIVGILTCMSRKNSIQGLPEPEKSGIS